MIGDALTEARVWSYKATRAPSAIPYGNAKWILPIFGLWHLRYNFLQLLISEHGGSLSDDGSALRQVWASVYTKREFKVELFNVADGLVRESFESRILALFLQASRTVLGPHRQISIDNPFQPLLSEEVMPNRQAVEELW